MTDADMDRIELALGIVLPDAYRRGLVPFPIPCLRGNADSDIWDDPDRLIAHNLELRSEWLPGFQPWPWHWYFVGGDEFSHGFAVDLSDTSCPAVWCDHRSVVSMQGGGTPLRDWLPAHVATMRADEPDPDGPPEVPRPPTFFQRRPLLTIGLVTGACIVAALLVGSLLAWFAWALGRR